MEPTGPQPDGAILWTTAPTSSACLGLKTVNYKYGLSKEELFAEAIAHDRGRVRADGPSDEQKAYSTKLGTDGPLVYYTDPRLHRPAGQGHLRRGVARGRGQDLVGRPTCSATTPRSTRAS